MKAALLIISLLTGTIVLAQEEIDREEVMVIGGIRQYVRIQGNNSTLPLLLFLHGGPGGSVMNYAHRFTGQLQKHFLVVHWDQRETGRTLQLNPSPVPLSYELFQRDTHELIQVLLKRFQRDKLYLAGHSWGTALGFHIARRYPGLLYAYIPIGPMINQRGSEQVALDLMKEKALKTGDRKQVAELSRIHVPFQTGEELYLHRKWLLQFSGSTKTLSKSYVESWAATWLTVFNEASRENLLNDLPAIGCPVYFCLGRNDYQTNSRIAEEYYNMLQAPRKGLYWFEFSGHGIPTSEPGRLQEIIIGKVLPETFMIPTSAQPVISDQ